MSRERDPEVRARRRAQIVAAARSIVAARGLQALTFSALEQELGCTRGVVTWHFRDKDEVVRAVLADAIAEIDAAALAAIRAEATFPSRARAVVREMVRGWLGGGGAGLVLVSLWGRADPLAAEINATLYARYRGWSADLVRAGQSEGSFRADADPEVVGRLLVGLVLGIVLQALAERSDPDAVVALAGEVVVRWLAAE